MDESPQNKATGRLPVQTVERLHRHLGGDARVEDLVLQFIGDIHGAKSLLYLSPDTAWKILQCPADFLREVRNHREPELLPTHEWWQRHLPSGDTEAADGRRSAVRAAPAIGNNK